MQLLILPVLCHKSATTCQVDSHKVSNSKVKNNLCKNMKPMLMNLRLFHSSHTNESQFSWHSPHKNDILVYLHLIDTSNKSLRKLKMSILHFTGQAINGGWSSYGPFGSCTKSCGGGLKFRRRTCNNPPPSNGGLVCPGLSVLYTICNNQRCPGI